MVKQMKEARREVRAFLHASAILVFFSCTSRFAIALSCQVAHHGPPTEAYTALLKGDYAKAETLSRAGLAANPADPELTAGLVFALLDEQKVQEAADTVKADLETSPHSAALLTLRGYVEFRQGVPWTAVETAKESAKLDPCNAYTQMLFARLLSLSSMFASMRDHIMMAHQLDPDNPQIRLSWITTLPPDQRLPELEAYLAEGIPQSEDKLRRLHQAIDGTRSQVTEPSKSCHLASSARATQIPLDYRGLEMKMNGHTFSLLFSSQDSGIVVNRNAARLAGLKPIPQSQPLSSNGGANKGYRAVVDSIQVGDLEFHDCVVQVIDNALPGTVVGFTGMGVFSHFLVTLDYPARKLVLDPLPRRPGEDTAVAQRLNSESEVDGGTESPTGRDGDAGTARTATGKQPERFFDRYIAPEMQDYSKVYRLGPDFILPTQLNGASVKLFLMQRGPTTLISPQAAGEVTKVDDHPLVRREGIQATAARVAEVEQITLQFAHISRQVVGVAAIDLSTVSKRMEMEISGVIGADTLSGLTLHIDYRDGLVKFDYDPKKPPH
jgi:tetratricopeptide (TPR) repeat protein